MYEDIEISTPKTYYVVVFGGINALSYINILLPDSTFRSAYFELDLLNYEFIDVAKKSTSERKKPTLNKEMQSAAIENVKNITSN